MSNCITVAIDSTELQKIVDVAVEAFKQAAAASVEAAKREVLTLGQYQAQVEETMPGADDLMPSELETRALHGLGAEVGEIYRLYQRVYTHGEYAEVKDLKKKVGDLMRCIAEYCIACDWSLEEICRDSLHRKEGDI